MPTVTMQTVTEPAFWMRTAIAELGVQEFPGPAKDNPRIIDYLKTVGGLELGDLHDEIPWCSAFANWVLFENGIRGTRSPAARSFLKWGLPDAMKIKSPRYGCVVVLRRGNAAWQGHVGFYICQDQQNPLYFKMLGGNQADSNNISRYRIADVLGYRWPVYTVRFFQGERRGCST